MAVASLQKLSNNSPQAGCQRGLPLAGGTKPVIISAIFIPRPSGVELDSTVIMFMQKLVCGALVGAALLSGISGCSSSSSSSSTVKVNVTLNQEEFQDAYIWSVAITEGGQVTTDTEGRPGYTEYRTEDDSEASFSIPKEEIQQFVLVGKTADTDTDTDGTTRTCQWVAGCTVNGTLLDFGSRYEQTGSSWRTVAYALAKNERVRITPYTELAAALAYDRLYVESSAAWEATGFYSANSVLQSVSQLSRLFGVDDVQGSQPADLTEINRWNGNQSVALNSIRYGALIAAWQHLKDEYESSGSATYDTFEEAVEADLISNDGQLMQSGGDQTTSLGALLQAARDNLAALTITNTTASTYVATLVTSLDSEIGTLVSGELTDITPDTLLNMMGSSDYDDYLLGLQRTKAFVDVLRDYDETFFEDGYRAQLDDYVDMIKAVGDEHEDELNTFRESYIQTAELYNDCYLNAGCPGADSSWTWLTSIDSYNVSTGVLTLNGGDITVSQEVADINTTDSDDEPTRSNAIDILIIGTYNIGDLVFKIDHTYKNDKKSDGIESSSGVRVYYTSEVSALADPASNERIGYELRWSDFQIYNPANLSTSDELEFNGSFRLFYRGVRDPQDSSSDLHFNIDTVVLNSRISDQVSSKDSDDKTYSTVYIAATSENASDYYPEKEFASFNGFFNPNSNTDFTKGSVVSDLVTYETGSETVLGYDVQYLDMMVPMGDSRRYRLYPTVERADTNDVDSDGDTDELVNVYDIEICDLTGSGSAGWTVDTCDPKTRYYGEANFSDMVHDIWASGAISRIEIPGRGLYFVEWPASSSDEHGCLVLDELISGSTLAGTLYSPYVLGLNSLRFTTRVNLDGEPKTLLDVYLTAPTEDEYNITAALSHDYSSLTSSTVYLGTGKYLDRIVLNYRTDQTFENTGSLSIYKDGVSLSLDDGTTENVDSTLTAYLNQSTGATPLPYTYYVTNEGKYERCVTANVAEWDETASLEDSVFYLNYRDVVYGRILQESGTWIIRYIDGTWETLK
jgi:hypothetical protein